MESKITKIFQLVSLTLYPDEILPGTSDMVEYERDFMEIVR